MRCECVTGSTGSGGFISQVGRRERRERWEALPPGSEGGAAGNPWKRASDGKPSGLLHQQNLQQNLQLAHTYPVGGSNESTLQKTRENHSFLDVFTNE